MAEVGLMLPGWGLQERATITRRRIRALNTQLQQLMRETYDFSAKPNPRPREGMQDVAPALRELFAEWVPWFQQALEQPPDAYETDAIPTRLDGFAARYDAMRERIDRRLRMKNKRSQTVPSEAFTQETEPSIIDQMIKAPGASLTLVGLGGVLLLLILAWRSD